MKYLPTIDLWNPAFQSAVRNGQLKLQVGQWVKCGSDKKSRFVCITPSGKSIWASHWQGNSKATLSHFKALHKVAKASKYI
jgi:hypothetical protein